MSKIAEEQREHKVVPLPEVTLRDYFVAVCLVCKREFGSFEDQYTPCEPEEKA